MADLEDFDFRKAAHYKSARIRLYRIALIASLILNALLGTAFWLYIHFAETLSMISDAVG